MRSLTRFMFFMALSLAGPALVQSQDNSRNKGGSITGRVTIASKPVAGVTVTVSAGADALSGSGASVKTTTDDEGRFRISNLPSGTYYVWPFVPAFVVNEGTGVYPQGKSVAVEDGEIAEDINFTLNRGAAITGRVTDAAGRPLIEERIRILPVDPNLRRLISSVYPSINSILTDDRGVYRVYGLPSGKYKVAIGDQFAAFTATRGRRFYPQTFHPDVTDEAKATLIELTEGNEASNVDITVARAMTGFAASGTVIDAEKNQPVSGVSFGLTIIVGGRPSGFMSGNGISTSTGAFRIDNLPPGRYAGSILPGSGTGYYGETQPFDITDGDVSNLEMKVHQGSMINGNLVFEGPVDRMVWGRLSQTRLAVTMSGVGSSVGTISYSDINPDGSFQAGPFQAGTAVIRLIAADRNSSAEFAALSIDVNGADKSRGIEITPGENISGVRITVGYGTGTIRGTVKVEGAVIPSEQYISASFSRTGSPLVISYNRVDARGRFVFEHVPPGNYEVVVTAFVDRRPVTARQSVVSSNGVVTEVTVGLNLSPGPSPGP
jgi:hypothetical protein